MKKKITIVTIVLAVCVLLTSCVRDVLIEDPYVDVSDSEITEWNDGDSFDVSAML